MVLEKFSAKVSKVRALSLITRFYQTIRLGSLHRTFIPFQAEMREWEGGGNTILCHVRPYTYE